MQTQSPLMFSQKTALKPLLDAGNKVPCSSSYASSLGGSGFQVMTSQLVSSMSMPEGLGLGLKMTLMVGSITDGLADASYATEPDSVMPATPPDVTPASRYPPPSPVFSVDMASISFSPAARAPVTPTHVSTPEFTLPPPPTRSMNENLASLGASPDFSDDVFVVGSGQPTNAAMSAAIDRMFERMTFSERDDFEGRSEERTSCDGLGSTSDGGDSPVRDPARLGLGLSVPTEPSEASIASSSSIADEVSDRNFGSAPESLIGAAFGSGGQDGLLSVQPEDESGVRMGHPSDLGSLALARRSRAAVNSSLTDDDEENSFQTSYTQCAPGLLHRFDRTSGWRPRRPRPRSIFEGLPLVLLSPILEVSSPMLTQSPVSVNIVVSADILSSSGLPIIEGPSNATPVHGQTAENDVVLRPVPANRGKDSDEDNQGKAESGSRLARLWTGVRVGVKTLRASLGLKIRQKIPAVVTPEDVENFVFRFDGLEHILS